LIHEVNSYSKSESVWLRKKLHKTVLKINTNKYNPIEWMFI